MLIGLETEYGITRGGNADPETVDVVAESIALVRACTEPGVLQRWDYGREDPHADARGFRVRELRQDRDESAYVARDVARALSRSEIKSDILLANGARFYNDHAHPEYSTPECARFADLLTQDAVGDRLVLACAARRTAEQPEAPVRVFKNNSDFQGHSYGCHENYLVPRAVDWETLASGMQAFLVTRQIFAGAGKYGWEQEDRWEGPGFQISQRADFFSELQSVDTMQRRPLINTRDEPHADPRLWRRFHVIIGDSNLMPYATWLKVGTTALVLRALAAGAPASAFPRLQSPVDALRRISRDPERRWECRLVTGKPTTAVAVQRLYLDIVRLRLPVRSAEDDAVLTAWEGILHDLAVAPRRCADRVDWVAKQELVERFRATHPFEPGERLERAFDLAYHDLHPEEGLFPALVQSGRVTSPPGWTPPGPGNGLPAAPTDTRACIRGACVSKFGPAIVAANWDGLILADPEGSIEVDLRPWIGARDYAGALQAISQAKAPRDLLAHPGLASRTS